MPNEPAEPASDGLTARLVAQHEALIENQSLPNGEESQLAGAAQCLKLLEDLRQELNACGDSETGASGPAMHRGGEHVEREYRKRSMPPLPRADGRADSRARQRGDGSVVTVTERERHLPEYVGRFRLLAEVGRGGHGIVYRAHDPLLNRDVALKVPRLETLASSERRSRFLQESAAVAGLSHPNIVTVFECGDAGISCFIASEFCAGPTLAAWLAAQPVPVEPSLAAAIVADLADAVAHVHSRGILHRDIKPGNVLLHACAAGGTARPPDDGWAAASVTTGGQRRLTPKLTDFGLAKLLEGSGVLTQTGAVLGTPLYMAPEQAQGLHREVGTTADIYSLGVILYELLTGRTPFAGDSPLEALRRVAAGEVVPPRDLRPDVSRDLQAICLRCLEFRSGDRYPTALALRDDLRACLAGGVVLARDPGRIGRFAKWARRSPATAAFAVTGLLATVVGFAVITSQWLRAEHYRTTAEVNLQRAHLAIRDMHEVLFEGDTYDGQEFQTLRRELMDVSLRHYLDIADQSRDDSLLQSDIAETCYQTGLDAFKQRRWSEAERWLEQSIAIWRRLLQEQPGSRKYNDDLSKALLHLARTSGRDQRDAEAVAQLQECIAIRSAILSAEGDHDAMFIGTLSDAWHELGLRLQALGELEQSLAALQSAHDMANRTLAVSTGPHHTVYRVRQSCILRHTADVLRALDRPYEALEMCNGVLEALADIHGKSPDARGLINCTLHTHVLTARVYLELGEVGAAVACQTRCDEFCCSLTLRDPGSRNIMQQVAANRRQMARLHAAFQRCDAAVSLYADACHRLQELVAADPADTTSASELVAARRELSKMQKRLRGRPNGPTTVSTDS